MSDFEADVITVDLSGPSTKGERIRHFHLGKTKINLSTGAFPLKRIVFLTEFPDWVNGIKGAINAALPSPDSDVSTSDVPRVFMACTRIAIWAIRRGHYSPGTISRGELIELGTDVALKGWSEILALNDALKALLKSPQLETFRGLLVGRNDVLVPTALSELIGIPVANFDIPLWFRQALAEKFKRPGLGQVTDVPSATSAAQSKTLNNTLRAFSPMSPSVQSIPSIPMRELQKIRNDVFAGTAGGTANISPEEATALFTECNHWVYTYGRGVVQILELCRIASKSAVSAGKFNAIEQLPEYRPKFEKILNSVGLAGVGIGLNDSQFINCLVKTLFSAVAALSATYNGRRINEVVGHKKKYGFYHGCVTQAGESSGTHRLDSHLQKKSGLPGWHDFPCNDSTSDCVMLLESLDRLLSGTDEVLPARKKLAKRRRTHWLFRYRDYSADVREPPTWEFDWTRDCTLLLSRAGLRKELFDGTHPPFRRIFILVHMFRFEHKSLLSLNRQVGQFSLDHLTPYYTDPAGRPEDRRAYRLWRKREEAEINLLAEEGGQELLAHYVRRLLSGERVGGKFPLLVAALCKGLARSARFRAGTLDQRADLLSTRLIKRGYRAEPGPGPCMLGSARHTRKQAHCTGASGPEPDRKSPSVCSGCINHATSESVQSIYVDERELMLKQSKNMRLPAAARAQSADAAARMQELIDAESQMANVTQATFKKIFWAASIAFPGKESSEGKDD
ncbi:hypothetical protein [Roseateles koreensis]|uniref:Integrase n=1 Tax=Roseateles koreensis TaxID=2987526 RepID=A0ABT5KWW7_9BURK|nr:hypothetical protein [Roseateles koreensis]MDC8786321.1 hypothetical protein [Roseateles koreensis]